MSTLKVDTLQTTGGAGLYPAKAWVNFNSTGTVAIRDSENVSSLTDNGTGDCTANFDNALSSSNYAGFFMAGNFDASGTCLIRPHTLLTNSLRVEQINLNGNNVDRSGVTLGVVL
tara:strand:+ start:792 stop:1136 length:345 start_codon:yes stop_codon:yes gene_type:complete